jgi:glutamate carboxypeptidase
MKASLAMACAALEALADRNLLDGVGVRVLLVPDEELGSGRTRSAIERAAGEADVCLGLEAAAPDGAVVVARGAVGAVIVRTHGRTAHVSDEPPGASALSALAPLVARLEALSDRSQGVSVSAGILRAGTARQVVPAEAELHLDLRAPDAQAAEDLERQVRELVAGPAAAGVTVALEGGFTRPPWSRSLAGDRLLALAQAAGDALDEPVTARTEKGGSDASFAGALGVATLDGLGPICHNSCSRRETVEVPSLIRRGAIFGALVSSAGGLAS